MSFRKLDKPLHSLHRAGVLPVPAGSPCACVCADLSSPRASAFCLLGTAGKRSILCHPGTFKITVLHFNYNVPGGNTVLDFLVLEAAGFLSLCFSLFLICCLSSFLPPFLPSSIYRLYPSQMPFGRGLIECMFVFLFYFCFSQNENKGLKKEPQLFLT